MTAFTGVVANTDKEWFDHFRPTDEPRIVDEVNFWRPLSQQSFRALATGGPFFLRLKRPYNVIAGFGFFAGQYALPVKLAWEVFGRKNGDPTFDRFLQRIGSYRRRAQPGERTRLTCLVLRDTVFLPQSRWIPWGTAEGWARNIVSYKSYALDEEPGKALASASLVAEHQLNPLDDLVEEFSLVETDGRAREGLENVVRQGQGTFRLRVMNAYDWRCAITTEHAVPVLDAAHIQPYLGPASNHVQNGIVLRTDLHRLYDDGYITVTPEMRLEVSQRLKEEFDNGEIYYRMEGQQIVPPAQPALRPSKAALLWHAENVFR